MQFHVHALWDDEAQVWVAQSDDLPGLVAEADTVEALLVKLKVLVPELAELNLGPMHSQGSFTLTAERELVYS
jgi:hypothetical protein